MSGMEINTLTLQNALLRSSSAQSHARLDELLSKIDPFTVNEILSTNPLSQIDGSIRELINGIFFESHRNPHGEDAGSELASLFASQRNVLQKAINDGDLSKVVIYQMVQCYFNVSLIDTIDFDDGKIEALSSKILTFLNSLRLDLTTSASTPLNEKRSLESYVDGLKDNNIEEVYRFIHSVENGGGLRLNHHVKNMISFLSEIDLEKYGQALSNRKQPHEYVFFIESLPDRSGFLSSPKLRMISSKWIQFELIRQITRKVDLNAVLDEYRSSMVMHLRDLAQIDTLFFYRAILFFSKSVIFNESLALVLAEMPKEKVKHTVENAFPLNKSNYYLESKTKLLNSFVEVASDENYSSVLEIVFDKWVKLFSALERDSNVYVSEIVLTDYANYLIHYHYKFTSNEKLLDEIESICDFLKYIHCFWSQNQNHQTTLFFLNLSKLNILGYALKAKEIISDRHSLLVQEIFSDNLIKARFLVGLDLESKSAFVQNFNLK